MEVMARLCGEGCESGALTEFLGAFGGEGGRFEGEAGEVGAVGGEVEGGEVEGIADE
jgi:hypothetical protein